jgi:hypothetical protein
VVVSLALCPCAGRRDLPLGLRPDWRTRMERRTFLGTLTGGLLAPPLAAAAQEPEAVPLWIGISWLDSLSLLLIAGVVFLLFTGILACVSSRRRRRKVAKILVSLAAGAVCGGFWMLLVNTAGATPNGANETAVLGFGGMLAALIAASLLRRPNRGHTVVARSMMTVGFHSLALPIAALISTVAGDLPGANLRLVALSVGGFISGVLLVFVGDRELRRQGRYRPRRRVDLARPYD